MKTFFIAIADGFFICLNFLFKLFNSFFNLIFKNKEDKYNNINNNIEIDNEYDKNNNYNNNYNKDDNDFNKNNDFNNDNKRINNIFSKLKNVIFPFNEEDETFIFKQLQINSNSNENNDNKGDSYWNKKYSLANQGIDLNIESFNEKNLQKGYLNKIIGEKISTIINIKLFFPSVLVLVIILTILSYFFFGFEIAMAIILLFLMIVFGIIYLPKMNKDKNKAEISKELPYALRQMVTELRSGKGLHDTIASIASSDYGALSFEFSRVIEEIKYGGSTEKALINMSRRVSSDGLSRAVQQIVGTLRTGGNLANTLNIIAEDVSYDFQIKLKDYSQKLNAFIMIYTFLAILGPVILLIMLMAASTVMGDIVPSNVVLIMYIFFFPMIVVFMGLMIKRLEPSL